MSYIRTSGVSFYEPSDAYNGFVLYSASDGVTRLIDMNGETVNQWPFPGLPPRILDPALTGGQVGNIGLQLSQGADTRGGIWNNTTIGELTWEGEKLWEWGTEAPGGAARQNHDWELLPNGNRLVLVTVPRVVPGLSQHIVGDQGIYEVTPHGKIVWEWLAGDHLAELGLSDAGLQDLRSTVDRNPGDIWGYLELNTAKTVGPNRWFQADSKSVFHPDNIIISSRKANVIGLIDKVSGAVVWRLGPNFAAASGEHHDRIKNRQVPRPLDQISGQHNPHLIAEGLPGAGNLLVFDNQGGAGYPPAPLGIFAGSRVLEIDPVTQNIVWQYTAEDSGQPPWEFFSSFVGGAQRLPNGNTLVTEGMNGRIFQVTPKGNVVWEYKTPHSGHAPGSNDSVITHLVYRAQAVPDEWVPAHVPPSASRIEQRQDATPGLN